MDASPTPATFVVYVVTRNPQYKQGKPTMQRVGSASTLKRARELVVEQRRGMRDPMWVTLVGPMFDDAGIQRRYEIWRADWKKVE